MEGTGSKGAESAPRPQKQDSPACYGDADHVCPRDDDGFMQPCVECLSCELLKGCLQTALRAQGLIPTPFMEKPAVSRVSRFLKRWSDRKLAESMRVAEDPHH